MANPTNIPAPRVPITDERTGLMSREWYRFFSNMFNQVAVDGTTASIQDLELSASGLAADSLTEVLKSIQDLELSVLPQTASTGGTTYSVFTSTTNGLAPASGGGTTNYLRADGTWATPPGTGGVTFANPTATVGPTATNGVAITAMRSDAAPAIDLTANYTYTGQWTFSRSGTTSALNIYANATAYQMVMGYAGTAEFKMDCLQPIGMYITGTKYLAVTAGNVDVPSGTLTVASTSVRDGAILTSGTVNAARLPTFGTAAAGIVPASGGGTTNFLRADGTWAAPAGGGGTPANPTASVGLTAVNGVATTYMRSDAAPALDVTIAPTWSGLHTFSQTVTSTASTTGSSATGAYTYGALGYSDQNNLLTLQSGVNTYNQLVLQNTSALSAASADLTISNNNGTATTFYGNFGMNSSGWAGTAGTASLNAPNMVYVTATSGDLALGTTTSNSIRFVVAGGADAATIDTSSRLGIGVTSPTAMLHLKAGTATANTAPLKFNSGTNLTTAEAGAVEYNGTAAFLTQQTTTGRGILLAPQVVRIDTGRTKTTNNTTLEAIFDAANDVINLTANTLYYFRAMYIMSTSATGSAAGIQTGFLFSNAQQAINYRSLAHVQTSGTAQTSVYISVATATTVTPTGTAVTPYVIELEGWFKSNATTGGTFTPAFTQSVVGTTTAPTAGVNTWFMLYPMSATVTQTNIAGNWA